MKVWKFLIAIVVALAMMIPVSAKLIMVNFVDYLGEIRV